MNREDIYKRLNSVFQDVFGDDELLVDETTTAQNIDGWDSLRHITLLAAIEDEFGVSFSMSDTRRFLCVGDIERVLGEYGK